ncbi:hypothetical protein H5407_19930 [Mitsuaria sp. WAJ17]|uniref:hypothetical protein n=1 Tax=Mitsuaria sp. WAJ17 TaxID=2761452 RepID=UPI0015FECCF9|nr:hypothetical protein [Mitsuaria sp. WAJ17]MBB2487510.1 hypothetical protein [Mitsuaria sp. WAJ17]
MGEIRPAPGTVLNRDFRATAANATWLTGIAEFPIPAGKGYLAPQLGCFDGWCNEVRIITSREPCRPVVHRRRLGIAA